VRTQFRFKFELLLNSESNPKENLILKLPEVKHFIRAAVQGRRWIFLANPEGHSTPRTEYEETSVSEVIDTA
jgi:hypothetical protein